MITKMRYIPVTETSKPFVAAAKRCDFDKLGYVEDEYFMYGTANVYDEDERHQAVKIFDGAPYCTRLMIRRPADVSKFSGNVCIEIVNSTANMDIDRMWISNWPYITRNGDIYIGISSKGHVVDSLKLYDPERYADINWDNPMPDREIPDAVKNAGGLIKYLPQYELGLFWDMLVELAKLLRTQDELNPIKEYGKCWLYLLGWSQSTSYINRMHATFSYRPENCEGGPLFDGYFSAGGFTSLAPINNAHAFPIAHDGRITGGVVGVPEPFMFINTDSETYDAFWYGDFDEPCFKFRTWQLTGTSHDSKYTLLDYYGEEDLSMFLNSLGRKNNRFTGATGEPLEVLYDPVFCAALKALELWVREGIPAPHAPKAETYISDKPSNTVGGTRVTPLKDAFGNPRGGIRVPSVVYPTARYQNYNINENGEVSSTFGTAYPFSAALLKELYGSLENYCELLSCEYDRLVGQGFLLKEDKEAFLSFTLDVAKQRGLE